MPSFAHAEFTAKRRSPAGKSFLRAWKRSFSGPNYWPSLNPSIPKANIRRVNFNHAGILDGKFDTSGGIVLRQTASDTEIKQCPHVGNMATLSPGAPFGPRFASNFPHRRRKRPLQASAPGPGKTCHGISQRPEITVRLTGPSLGQKKLVCQFDYCGRVRWVVQRGRNRDAKRPSPRLRCGQNLKLATNLREPSPNLIARLGDRLSDRLLGVLFQQIQI